MIGYEPVNLEAPPSDMKEMIDAFLDESGLSDLADHTGLPHSLEQARKSGYQAMLLREEQETCGYLLYRVVHDHIYLAHFYLKPERRKDATRREVFELLLQGPWRTVPMVRIFVRFDDDREREFWEEIGFDEVVLGMELDRIRRSKHAKSCGFVVYCKRWGNIKYLLVKHEDDGHWGFPKGHVEVGESEEETAFRETEEEVGLRPSLINGFCHRLHYLTPKGKRKVVVLFLGRLRRPFLPRPKAGEISHASWFSYEEARETLTFDNARIVLDSAQRFLT
ncbi:MAG: NUDIX domain-containing protein [Alkalispirochaetaceae bacterium]